MLVIEYNIAYYFNYKINVLIDLFYCGKMCWLEFISSVDCLTFSVVVTVTEF